MRLFLKTYISYRILAYIWDDILGNPYYGLNTPTTVLIDFNR